MATDSPHKQEFRIRDFTTRSVVLFPTRAQVIRDIKDIALQPGANQIIIDGLGPTVDKHSIKVEGTGAATITDLTVDLLPNREVYDDIYPSDDEESDNDDEDDDESEPEEIGAVKSMTDKIEQLKIALIDEKEKLSAANSRLVLLDNFSESTRKNPIAHQDLGQALKSYQEERQKVYNDHKASTVISENLQRQISKCEKEKGKLGKAAAKAQEKALKGKTKIREKAHRKKMEIQKEKDRVKAERDSFWPKKVYRITISLEPSVMTPSSSRRSSIDSDVVKPINPPTSETLKTGEINIILSYITYSASWAPRYDLSLNTTSSSGVLEYGAELTNTTSETWRDAKVILSTSQTSYQGLNETIPTLQPWHVHLVRGGRGLDVSNSALFSKHELDQKRQQFSNVAAQSHQSRKGIFGYNQSVTTSAAFNNLNSSKNMPVATVQPAFGQPSSGGGGLFGSHSTAQPSFGQPSSLGGSLFGSHSRSTARQVPAAEERSYPQEEQKECENLMDHGRYDNGPGSSTDAQLVFEEGAWEESGMTTTYDVPGLKTIEPSNSTVKHKIAKMDFKGIIFSHIVIGKLRQVAFLKARLRNNSKITLLKGPLGLTLDGSFLGQATLPRCSPGESFSLPLGVDPAITISYPKPTVHRSQSGIFSKEDSNIFNRTTVITNNKQNAPIHLTILDQIPVSEDERLKIEITNPRGLKVGETIQTGYGVDGDPVPVTIGRGEAKNARASVYNNGQQVSSKGGASKWGSADATVKKGGEVSWDVKLNPGQGVKLVLEYQATFPGGEIAVSA